MFFQKSECANASEHRVLKLQFRTKPKRDIVSSFKLVPSKIIHRIIFEVALYSQSVFENLFSCKKVLELSQ